jgi:hypothetical protein
MAKECRSEAGQYVKQEMHSSQSWSQGSPISKCQHLARDFLLSHHMEGDDSPEKEGNLFIMTPVPPRR